MGTVWKLEICNSCEHRAVCLSAFDLPGSDGSWGCMLWKLIFQNVYFISVVWCMSARCMELLRLWFSQLGSWFYFIPVEKWNNKKAWLCNKLSVCSVFAVWSIWAWKDWNVSEYWFCYLASSFSLFSVGSTLCLAYRRVFTPIQNSAFVAARSRRF